MPTRAASKSKPGAGAPRLLRLNVLGLRERLPMSALPGYLAAQATVARGPLLFSGALSEGQFYSPPESFAGDGLVGGGTAFREGIYKEWGRLALFFLFLLSVPWGKPASHTHFHPPHILHLYPNPTTSPPLPIVICACSLQDLTMNQMKKLLGRKASLPRYLAAHPHPAFRADTQETGQCWAQPGWAGASQQRGDLSSLNASAHLSVDPTVYQAHWSTSCLGTSGEQPQPQLLAPGVLQGPGDQLTPTSGWVCLPWDV